jgi:hypothetical protein
MQLIDVVAHQRAEVGLKRRYGIADGQDVDVVERAGQRPVYQRALDPLAAHHGAKPGQQMDDGTGLRYDWTGAIGLMRLDWCDWTGAIGLGTTGVAPDAD